MPVQGLGPYTQPVPLRRATGQAPEVPGDSRALRLSHEGREPADTTPSLPVLLTARDTPCLSRSRASPSRANPPAGELTQQSQPPYSSAEASDRQHGFCGGREDCGSVRACCRGCL